MPHISPLKKPKSTGNSSWLPDRTMVLIAAVILGWSARLATAQDTAPPGRFELLIPGDNTVVYASIHGSKPLLAWQQSAGNESGVKHYEIWLDGKKVDAVPAGIHGHLPGDRYGNYEPYRPHGFLAAEKVCYYTPLASKLTSGSHRWHVIAVDGDGNKRRSSSVFSFTVETLDAARVWVNHLGYLSSGNHRVVVDGGTGASSFDVLNMGGKVVFSGSLKKRGGAFGNYLSGDFTLPGACGTYRIKAGPAYSMWFPIGLGAKLNYEDYLRKYRHAYLRKRCGDTKANWGGKACHLEDARMAGGKRHGIVGGWHASSDVRKIMRILQPALYGLVELKRIVDPPWNDRNDSILDEIKWGNQYIHAMQRKDGAILQHYHLWCGLSDWSEGINRYTNNVIGDADDRLLPENTLVVDMVSQSRFIRNQTAIYRLYRSTDPAYAGKCLKAAARCYGHFEKTWPVVTDYRTAFCARPYMEKETDLMPLAYGVRANLSMYLATEQPAFKDRAVALADQLVALQENKYIENQKEVRGFFYGDAKRDAIFCSYMAHGGLDGAPGAVTVLADLCDALPAHARCPQWKESLRSYLEDYLLPLSGKNAFGIVPGYLSRKPLNGGKQIGGLYYQYLDDNRGVNKFLLRKAILLARGARLLGNPELRDAAWRQVGWILGNNPLNASTVFGAGHKQPRIYKGHLAPHSDGMLVQGIGGNDKDMPLIRQGHWRHCEMELHHTAWFAQALFELLSSR